jgi:hypothetical protein
MDIEKIKEKIAKNVQERANLELEMIKHRKAEKEVIESNKRRESVKRQTQIDHEAYLLEEQRERDQIEFGKSDWGRTERARREARVNIQRDREAGLTNEEIRVKYLDSKARIREFNKQSNKRTGANLRGAKTFLSDMY